jgi:hypothetical protein
VLDAAVVLLVGADMGVVTRRRFNNESVGACSTADAGAVADVASNVKAGASYGVSFADTGSVIGTDNCCGASGTSFWDVF